MRAVVPRRYTHGKEMGFDGLNLGYYVGMGRICGISVWEVLNEVLLYIFNLFVLYEIYIFNMWVVWNTSNYDPNVENTRLPVKTDFGNFLEY